MIRPAGEDPAGATLAALIADASARARTSKRRVLVSVAERIGAIDPLGVLEAVAARAATDGGVASYLAAGRMFWARPRDGFAIAAIGAAMTLAPTGAERFAAVDQAWAGLLEGSLISDPSVGAEGVGPVLMGGFAFEPHGPRAPHWKSFPSALLVLPRLQVTTVGDSCWVTTTVIVGADGAPDIPVADLARLRACALAPAERAPGRRAPAVGTGHRLSLEDDRPAAEWRELVASAVDEIRREGLEKVVLARAVRATSSSDPDLLTMLRHLRRAYPDCYVFGCWRGGDAFVGASPERLVRLDERDVRASSLAGSAPRGATREEDLSLSTALLASAKDRTEHAMVRQALCAGLAELCDDVVAPLEPSLFTLPHVHHLHTAVRAKLRDGHSLLDLVATLHPTPAVGGAPRDAALRFIREHERLDRGWYAAPVGWVGRDGGEFAVALRSALVRGREAWLFAGSGIVADSGPEEEYEETLLKLRPMEQALTIALSASSDADEAEPLPAGAGDGGSR